MQRIIELAHRLASKVISKVVTFVYNPYQVEVFQLVWDLYDIIATNAY